MSSSWGNNLKISLFGESHGAGVGLVIDGLEPGIKLDFARIELEMARRRADGKWTTARCEPDMPQILSGVMNGYTCGTPLSVLIENTNTISSDYNKSLPRPGHADYTGHIKYRGFNDYRGGGHFSARVTAGLVFAGAIAKTRLSELGIEIGSHILSVKDRRDTGFNPLHIDLELFSKLRSMRLPVIDPLVCEEYKSIIDDAAENQTSVGGIIEVAAVGLEAGLGSPFFDSMESVLSHLFFSVPAVKGVEFGMGFSVTDMYGHEANDSPDINPEGKICFASNNNGGINGGISNGMPVICRLAFKPTPSVGRPQDTVNLETMSKELMSIKGRHDPCVVIRAVPVVEAVMAIGLLDLYYENLKYRSFTNVN